MKRTRRHWLSRKVEETRRDRAKPCGMINPEKRGIGNYCKCLDDDNLYLSSHERHFRGPPPHLAAERPDSHTDGKHLLSLRRRETYKSYKERRFHLDMTNIMRIEFLRRWEIDRAPGLLSNWKLHLVETRTLLGGSMGFFGRSYLRPVNVADVRRRT